jgi:hypothetical protein
VRSTIQWDEAHRGGNATDRKRRELSDFSASAKMEEDSSTDFSAFLGLRSGRMRADRAGAGSEMDSIHYFIYFLTINCSFYSARFGTG